MNEELELRENSLFINGTLFTFANTDEQILWREILSITGNELDKYHIVKIDDRLDRLAYDNYKDLWEDASKFWWVIADANNIFNPLDLSDLVGQEILIPDLVRVRLELYESTDS